MAFPLHTVTLLEIKAKKVARYAAGIKVVIWEYQYHSYCPNTIAQIDVLTCTITPLERDIHVGI